MFRVIECYGLVNAVRLSLAEHAERNCRTGHTRYGGSGSCYRGSQLLVSHVQRETETGSVAIVVEISSHIRCVADLQVQDGRLIVVSRPLCGPT